MGAKSEEKKLLELFDRLTSEQQEKLIAFAEFLTAAATDEPSATEPLAIPRPARETVTMAIRRLVRAYPMLDRRRLMGEAAQLMAQHALQGRPSAEIIDELERIFSRHYRDFRQRGGRDRHEG
jgi:hypothetical protein